MLELQESSHEASPAGKLAAFSHGHHAGSDHSHKTPHSKLQWKHKLHLMKHSKNDQSKKGQRKRKTKKHPIKHTSKNKPSRKEDLYNSASRAAPEDDDYLDDQENDDYNYVDAPKKNHLVAQQSSSWRAETSMDNPDKIGLGGTLQKTLQQTWASGSSKKKTENWDSWRGFILCKTQTALTTFGQDLEKESLGVKMKMKMPRDESSGKQIQHGSSRKWRL